jgi:hypothetical protein
MADPKISEGGKNVSWSNCNTSDVYKHHGISPQSQEDGFQGYWILVSDVLFRFVAERRRYEQAQVLI